MIISYPRQKPVLHYCIVLLLFGCYRRYLKALSETKPIIGESVEAWMQCSNSHTNWYISQEMGRNDVRCLKLLPCKHPSGKTSLLYDVTRHSIPLHSVRLDDEPTELVMETFTVSL